MRWWLSGCLAEAFDSFVADAGLKAEVKENSYVERRDLSYEWLDSRETM
jgi:hypothetical protein